ncbi:ParB/Srx family N-terminal domain-containing protein [Gammaproteobacteria bacterium]|nr:ParB/Srx family N-terminal domain-containing protein [Gammaproteobacteria bacterium]
MAQERERFSSLAIQSHIRHTHTSVSFLQLPLKKLYVGLRAKNSDVINYVSVRDTPHFFFVKNFLEGTPISSVHGYEDYSQYLAAYWHPLDEDSFKNLIISIRENGYDADTKPILVVRSIRTPLPLGRYQVLDGFHRLAILAALGHHTVKVFRMRKKRRSMIKRFFLRGF